MRCPPCDRLTTLPKMRTLSCVMADTAQGYEMKLKTNNMDIWVFHREEEEPMYLLLRTSTQKANRWFFGAQFWQIVGGFSKAGEDAVECVTRLLDSVDLKPTGVWASEHVYTYYNARRKCIEIVPVFAAEVAEPSLIELTWEHEDYGWFSAEECMERVHFRGLRDGLRCTREYVTEAPQNPSILRLL